MPGEMHEKAALLALAAITVPRPRNAPTLEGTYTYVFPASTLEGLRVVVKVTAASRFSNCTA